MPPLRKSSSSAKFIKFWWNGASSRMTCMFCPLGQYFFPLPIKKANPVQDSLWKHPRLFPCIPRNHCLQPRGLTMATSKDSLGIPGSHCLQPHRLTMATSKDSLGIPGSHCLQPYRLTTETSKDSSMYPWKLSSPTTRIHPNDMKFHAHYYTVQVLFYTKYVSHLV